MHLAHFIASYLDEILVDWVAFARTQLPAARNLDETALLDHGKKILQDVVENMSTFQTERERKTKSEGKSESASTDSGVSSRSHARQREHQGFNVDQMVAEYRALRASVLRLWRASAHEATTRDIDDIIRFNEALDQALSESLAEFNLVVDRARDLFLGILGHDLRGPMSTIAGAAQLEMRRWPDDVRHAPVILRSVAQMNALLDDLMEFTSYRLGKGLIVKPKILRLDQLVRDTINEIEVVSSGRVLLLQSRGDMEGRWDAARLHQALSNLIFNALKYGVTSSPVWVEIDGTDHDQVLLTVRNAGKAISPELLPRLFDPLVREQREDDSNGSQVSGANLGLGLFVVREIATAHGGSVVVTSREEATEFRLCLPRMCSALESS
ncbi:sensor histidine kinase [Acidovorax sp. NCPPB 3576]|uniref:sensor histidine kinase n=1 Tax=Acidovorax sp. NCPPB 3576 TaxID=2940488 RepID=UPI00234B7A56|nr:HAMP domain-containing sensor histidine kinase [Acidovorax sp. NCPPB 3576]WCM89245.1 sensor histidine kinase [Acidovorax sp. NCPPB 3576]